MKKISFVFLLATVVFTANAQDRFFAQTYTSNILPKGSFDIELWHTSRFGHEGEYFHAMDQRAEYEVGLGRNVQTSIYFNRYQKSISDITGKINQYNEIGVSNEWKWKLTQPTSKTGVALYGEVGVKGDEIELETKLILDKTIGKNLFAFNAVYELEEEAEVENGKTQYSLEATPVEFDFGYMRNLSPSLGIGIELRNNNEIVKGSWQNSVLFAGPTINYRSDKWFVIANYLPQLGNLHKTAAFPGNKVLDDHEKAEARILVGFSF
ncbi:MAG: hypothetical protein ACM3VS_18765 [Candidatus Dadabacteria bacterium]